MLLYLAISSAQWLGISELWIAFGTGKHFRFLPIHELADTLGPQKCIALPFFHSLTGCDTVSFFGGKSKKTAWNTWKSYDSVTPAFCALANTPSVQCIEQWLPLLERFVVLLYDCTSSLVQHIKRAAYQAGHCWAQVMIAAPEMPSPVDWGWKKKNQGCGWEAL